MSTKDKTPEQIEQEELKLKLQQQYAAIKKMNVKQLNKALAITPSVLSKFNPKQVAEYLQNPAKYEKQMRNLSNYLYGVSAQYRQIIKHVATMPTYDYTLNIVEMPQKINKDKVIKAYTKSAQYIDKLNLPHEMSKALRVAFKEDYFYGYEHESKDSYFIQKMDADYCSISSIEDGVFNYAFDFAYFDSYPDSLDLYPEEFKTKYQVYKIDRMRFRWQELDSNKTICIKVMDDLQYGTPPYNTVFESIFDLDEYKKIKKSKTKLDNFLLLAQKIPMNDKSQDMNAFLIDLETAGAFHEQLADNVSEGISVATSPMDIESIKMEKSKSDVDTISQAQREVYTDSGLSQYLFNSDKNTSAGISKSISSDEQIVFNTLTQIERWVNRKLKKQSGTIKFYIKFLHITEFSREESFNRFLKAAQFGVPVKMEIGASLGLTPLEFLNKVILENDIFELHEKLKPLSSSHTQTNDEEGGRPTKQEDEISDSRQADLDNLDD